MADELDRHRLHQTDEPRLRGAVGRKEGRGSERGDRGCVEDRAAVSGVDHRAGTLLADDEAGGQDHADNLLPRLDLLLEKRLLAPGRGVRDDDVEPAGVGVRLPHSAAAVLDVGELRHDLARNGACRGDLLRDRVDPVGEVIHQVDPLRTLLGEAERSLPAHAAAAPGDEDDLSAVPLGIHQRTSYCRVSAVTISASAAAASTSAAALPEANGVPTVSYWPATYASGVIT